jgi:hypothetical protein
LFSSPSRSGPQSDRRKKKRPSLRTIKREGQVAYDDCILVSMSLPQMFSGNQAAGAIEAA